MKKFYKKMTALLTLSLAIVASGMGVANAAPSKKFDFARTTTMDTKVDLKALTEKAITSGNKIDGNKRIMVDPNSLHLPNQIKSNGALKAPKAKSVSTSEFCDKDFLTIAYLLDSDANVDTSIGAVIGPYGCFFEEGNDDTEIYLCDFGYYYWYSAVNDLECTYDKSYSDDYGLLEIPYQTYFVYGDYTYVMTAGYLEYTNETGEFSGYGLFDWGGAYASEGYQDMPFPLGVTSNGIYQLEYDVTAYEEKYDCTLVQTWMLCVEYRGELYTVWDVLSNVVFVEPNGVQEGDRFYTSDSTGTYVATSANYVYGGFSSSPDKFVIYNLGMYSTGVSFDYDLSARKVTANDQYEYMAYSYNSTGDGYLYANFYWTNLECMEEYYYGSGEAIYRMTGTYDTDSSGNTVVVTDDVVYLTNYEVGYYDFFDIQTITFDYDLFDQAGITDVTVGSSDSNAAVEYYNIQGMKVANPQAGQLYIKKRGNTTSKVIMQ